LPVKRDNNFSQEIPMRIWGLTLIAISLAASGLFGQAQSNMADLSGVVRDPSGSVVPGVEIVVTNTEIGLPRSTRSNGEGRYRVPLLPPGKYEVRAQSTGFAAKVYRDVVLTVGHYANLDIDLQVSQAASEISVIASANIIEPEKTVQASTIQETEIDNLPINGRSYLDFTLLTPGVTDRHIHLSTSVPQATTSDLSFAGQDQRSNSVTIDGADNIDIVSNAVRSTLSQEAIQEFQIARNSFSAEFGRARGGVINIVTKSGTNQYHGDGFFFFRNNTLDARNPFGFGPDRTPINPPFKRYQFGGTLGGPIVRDKTFFFASYEGLQRDESKFVTFLDDENIFRATPSQQRLFDFLGSTGVPALQGLARAFVDSRSGILNTTELTFPDTLRLFRRESGTFPFTADSNTGSVKLDHQLAPNNRSSVRLSFADSFDNGVEFGALQGVSNGVSFKTRDFSAVFSDTHIFSPTVLNESRFQYGRRRFAVPTNDPVGPNIIIEGVAEFGRQFLNPSSYRTNLFQFVDNVTFLRGDHQFKVGADFSTMDPSGFAEVFLGGQFTFAEAIPLGLVIDRALGPGASNGLASQLSTPVTAGGLGRPDLAPNILAPISGLQAFNLGLPISYFQGFGNPKASLRYNQLATYFQDNWKLRHNLTINLGIRYDVDWRPATLNVVSQAPFQFKLARVRDRNNIGPRFGFAWTPSNSGATVVRGGYGVYYQNLFQAVAFVSQVLSGQISQVFLPITGLPGFRATSVDAWGIYKSTGRIGEPALQSLGVRPGTTPSVILPGASDAVNPYSQHASLGLERAVTKNISVSTDYLLNRGVHLIRSRDINVRKVGPNRFELPALDPRFVQVSMLETSGNSIYHGLTVSMRKRYSDSSSAMVSYTLGKVIDDTTDFITSLQPNDQTNLRGERALSSFDQRHRLVLSGVWNSPFSSSSGSNALIADWTVSPIVTWSSGKPFNLLLGFDRNGDTHSETDRPILAGGAIVGRNTGRGPSFFSTDLRVARKFLLPGERANFEFIFEAFNLFNKVNYSGVNNVVGNMPLPSSVLEGSEHIPANRPLGFTAAFNPRQIQLGFRMNF
jgi:hypothetical protein